MQPRPPPDHAPPSPSYRQATPTRPGPAPTHALVRSAHLARVGQLPLPALQQAPQARALALGLAQAAPELRDALLQLPLRALQLGQLRLVLVPDALDAAGGEVGEGR